jgi:hypothetical protein
MANQNSSFDDQNRGTLLAIADDGSRDTVVLWANKLTHALVTSGGSGGGGNTTIADGVNGTIKATVFSLTNSKPLATQLVDANGNAITSFGGGTQYTDGVAAPAHPIGTQQIFTNAGGTSTAVSTTNGLPVVTKPDVFFTSTITAADAVVAAPTGNGVPLSGASTAGSLVALASPGGASAWVASITGTLSGTYYFEISINSTNGTDGTWINVNGRQTGLSSVITVSDYKTTLTGEFRGSPAGAKYFRVRNVGGSGLATTVTIGMGTGTGPVFLYSSIPSGTNTIGAVASAASILGGYIPGHILSAATTNATSIKGSPGTLGYLTASNVNAAPRYVKLYDKASAPTVGTDTPVATFIIPGNTAGAGTNVLLPSQGIKFSVGIALAITVEATDSGTTAVALNDIVINYGTI